jgi:alkylhydroperoxidase/carboxymuconolactone decarboxylase family protein YurZ
VRSRASVAHWSTQSDASRTGNDRHVCFVAERLRLLPELPRLNGAQHLGGSDADYELIAQVKQNYEATPISAKMKALLAIAGNVQKGGKHVTAEDIKRAREHGAPDKEIHDTVLIAAAFCMFNRYVDGLATWQPRDPEIYREIGKQTAQLGYVGRDYKKPLRAIAAQQNK